MNIDINNLQEQAEGIKNATIVGENTAERVGGLFCDIVDAVGESAKNVASLKDVATGIIDITDGRVALDMGLSSTNAAKTNIATYGTIKEGIYHVVKRTSSTLYTESDGYVVVGIMYVVKDDMGHSLQQLLFTNETMTEDAGHTDSVVCSYLRSWQTVLSLTTPKNEWSKWRDYVSTLFKQELIGKNVINGNTLIDGSVYGGKLADKSIGTEHLKDNSVIQQAIEDEAISTSKIQDNAVTIDKLDADLQQTINEVPKLNELEQDFTTQSLQVGTSDSIDLYTTIDGGGWGVSKNNPLDIFELNAVSAFFGNIEINFGAKNPDINWMYYGDNDDRAIYISATEFSLSIESAISSERVVTIITAEEITTPKLSITGGTSSELLAANGELATRITDDDIEKLFT